MPTNELCLFVAASHQTRLDTWSKAQRPIKVGIKGRGRSGTSRDSNPAGQCCSSAHLVQCEPDEASSFTNPNLGPGTYAQKWALTRLKMLSTNYAFTNHIYIYKYKQELALFNLQWLICHKTHSVCQSVSLCLYVSLSLSLSFSLFSTCANIYESSVFGRKHFAYPPTSISIYIWLIPGLCQPAFDDIGVIFK